VLPVRHVDDVADPANGANLRLAYGRLSASIDDRNADGYRIVVAPDLQRTPISGHVKQCRRARAGVCDRRGAEHQDQERRHRSHGSTLVSLPKIPDAPIQPLMKPRLLPIW
jgi:hypothetical protein